MTLRKIGGQMRRAIAATITGGLVLGGAVATPSFAAERGAGKGRLAAPAKPRVDRKSATAMKTVVYEGYEFQVPASWPVYRLDEYPQTCVRYDVHAVYLGTPGTDMQCPAGLVGRTQTVSFIPGQGAKTGSGARSPGQLAPTQESDEIELQRLPAVNGTITQNAFRHEVEVALGPATLGPKVIGTYGTDPAAVEQVLSTLRRAPAGTAQTAQSAPSNPAGMTPGASQRARLSAEPAILGQQHLSAASAVPAPAGATSPTRTRAEKARANKAPSKAVPAPTYTSWRGVPAHWPVEIIQSPPQPKPFAPVSGFDTCTAPSLATMGVWRSNYAAVGAYIGGVNTVCASGNLSAGWIHATESMGWGILPIYVGPQAPCWGLSGVLINPGSAVTQGEAAAADAISDAQAFGLPAGSPIYYDMEAYKGGSTCSDAVLAFLGAWDHEVAAAGYATGVYSSQDSGISDMQNAADEKTPGFTPPDAVWIALWDGNPSLSDGSLVWPLSDRSKQYAGNVTETIGGITLNIDQDIVGGQVARLLVRIPGAGEGCEPVKPVRVNRRRLISSRHGPTQRPSRRDRQPKQTTRIRLPVQ